MEGDRGGRAEGGQRERGGRGCEGGETDRKRKEEHEGQKE